MASITKVVKSGHTYWRVRWYDKRRAQREKTFKKRSEAARFAGGLEEHMALDVPTKVSKSSTFEEFAAAFLEASRKGRDGAPPLEYSTVQAYGYKLKKHIYPEIGSIRVTELTRDEMRDLMDALLTNLSRANARATFTLAKTVLNWAVDRELIRFNPAGRLTVQKSKRQKKAQPKIHSQAEMKRILAKAKELTEDPHKQVRKAWIANYALIMFLAHTGVRISEGLAVKKSDFTPDLSEVAIERRVDSIRSGRPSEERLGDLKSEHAHRTIPVPEPVRALLRALMDAHDHEWVFPSRTGWLRDQNNFLSKVWKPLQEKAGVTVLGLHSLRHFCASVYLSKGYYKEAQVFLGHHSSAFTMDTYGHLIDDGGERRKQIAEDVADAFRE